MSFINFNGRIFEEDHPIIVVANRGLRYGDGLFETMKMVDGDIPLFNLHMERLWTGLNLLQFELPKLFTKELLLNEIKTLASKNDIKKTARIRLTIIRGEGGLYDPVNLKPNYIIEASELPGQYSRFNENGLIVDIYSDGYKSCDAFANCKTNNYLLYAMGALYAKNHQLNDVLILNQHQRICDATIANIFWIKEGIIYTSPLSEGAVAGIMRKYLLQTLNKANYPTQELALDIATLQSADELFLTNAAYGLRWVGSFRNKRYVNTISSKIYRHFIQTIQLV